MTYPFNAFIAFDPADSARVAANSMLTIHAPGDSDRTPLEITDNTGIPLENPIQTNDIGAGPAFICDLPQVAWTGGGTSGFMSSYEGLRAAAAEAALSAAESQLAAEAAANSATAPTDAAVATLLAIPSETQEAADGRYTRRGELEVNVKDYGALGDGIADDWATLMAALTSGARKVYAPEGLYMVSDEVKVPTGVVFYGAGIDITVVKTLPGVAPDRNTVTNAANDRTERTIYDENLCVRDMTIDGNAWERPAGATYDQGTSLKLSTVRKSRVANVRAINGPLHCLDIMGSIYQDGTYSNVNTVVTGPSHAVVLENVETEDSQRDDGITFHGSHDITMIGFRSTRTRTPGENSQGFEVDEGCYRITAISGYVNGWTKGYQVKGHTFTTPAYDVQLISCVAENCNIGFDIQHINPSLIPAGQTSWARNVTLTDPIVIDPKENSPAYSQLKSLQIAAYANVKVRNLTVRDGKHNNVTIGDGATVDIDGVHAYNSWTEPASPTQGFVHLYASAGVGSIIKNLTIDNPISTSAIVSSGSGHALTIEGVKATGTDPTKACVVRQGLVAGDSCKGIVQTGFASDLSVASGAYAGAYKGISLDKNFAASFVGAGTPEALVPAFPGSLYRNTTAGVQPLWIKQAGNAATGWKAVTLA